MNREYESARKSLKRTAIACTVLATLAMLAALFAGFCLAELFCNAFTGGAFSLLFPLVAAIVVVAAGLAANVIGGGR